MTATNDVLSRTATAIARAHRRDRERSEDLAAFYAPTECWLLVDWEGDDLDAVVEPFGFESVEAFRQECIARGIPTRWLYYVLEV